VFRIKSSLTLPRRGAMNRPVPHGHPTNKKNHSRALNMTVPETVQINTSEMKDCSTITVDNMADRSLDSLERFLFRKSANSLKGGRPPAVGRGLSVGSCTTIATISEQEPDPLQSRWEQDDDINSPNPPQRRPTVEKESDVEVQILSSPQIQASPQIPTCPQRRPTLEGTDEETILGVDIQIPSCPQRRPTIEEDSVLVFDESFSPSEARSRERLGLSWSGRCDYGGIDKESQSEVDVQTPVCPQRRPTIEENSKRNLNDSLTLSERRIRDQLGLSGRCELEGTGMEEDPDVDLRTPACPQRRPTIEEDSVLVFNESFSQE